MVEYTCHDETKNPKKSTKKIFIDIIVLTIIKIEIPYKRAVTDQSIFEYMIIIR